MTKLHSIGVLCVLALTGCASVNGGGTPATNGNHFDAAYHCENGQHIAARYFPPDRAEVTTDTGTLDMHIARSADGARYVGGHRVWWTKGSGPGSTATLFEYGPDTLVTGDKITSCVQTGS